MIAVLDIDLMVKLARYGLLVPFEKLLRKCGWTKLVVQPRIDSTLDLAGKSGTLKKVKSIEEREAIAALVSRATKLALSQAGEALLDLCYMTPGIDPGDAVWICYIASTPDSVIFTGDRRALKGLLSDPKCAPLAKKIEKRVVCIEDCLMGLFDDVGYPVVRSQVRADPASDSALSDAFPSKTTARPDATLYLNGRIAQLGEVARRLLRRWPTL